jgi:hypothetical protein
MMHLTRFIAAAVLASAAPSVAAPAAPEPIPVLSTGKETPLVRHLAEERPTVVVFLRPSSSLERAFLQQVRGDAGAGVGVRQVHLQSGTEPIARQYEIKETPAALVYDRRGRLVTRSTDAAEIRAAVQKAAGVMRIDWVEDGDPRMAEVQRILGGRRPPPGILRTMSLKPEYLADIQVLSQKAHFADGFIDRRTKEMIATHVSALNKCKY